MKKLFTSAVALLLFIGACDFSDDYRNNCPPEEKYFDIKGLELKNPRIYDFVKYDYNPYDSVRSDHFYLEIAYEADYYSANLPEFSFIPSAYATPPCPIPGYMGSQEKLSELYLITLSDFNQQYKAGDTINAIATVRGRAIAEGASLQDLIDLNRTEGIKEQNPEIMFTQKPEPKVKHAFRLVINLQNGEKYTAQTKPIKVF